MRHDKKDGSVDKDAKDTDAKDADAKDTDAKDADAADACASATSKLLAKQAEAAKSINQLSKQEIEDLLKKVGLGLVT